MTKLIGFVYKASAAEQETANRWLSLASVPGQVYDISVYNPCQLANTGDNIVTFGPTAGNLVAELIKNKKLKNVTQHKLPSLKKLAPLQINTTSRKHAQDLLKLLGDNIKQQANYFSELIIHQDDLPDLTDKQLILLQKLMEENKQYSCIQATKDGKLIEVRLDAAQPPSQNANLSLSIAEICTLKIVMEILDVEEVKLVYNPTPITNKIGI